MTDWRSTQHANVSATAWHMVRDGPMAHNGTKHAPQVNTTGSARFPWELGWAARKLQLQHNRSASFIKLLFWFGFVKQLFSLSFQQQERC